jgi:hypothetical protein
MTLHVVITALSWMFLAVCVMALDFAMVCRREA